MNANERLSEVLQVGTSRHNEFVWVAEHARRFNRDIIVTPPGVQFHLGEEHPDGDDFGDDG